MPRAAQLDLVVRNGQVVAATQSLQGLVGATVNAEAATTRFAGATAGGERAVSRMAFGLTRMAEAGSMGGMGLRSVEFGLMSLLPGLGWGLVGIVGLIEVFNILHHSSADAAKQMEEDTKRMEASFGSLKIGAPSLTNPEKIHDLSMATQEAQLHVRQFAQRLEEMPWANFTGGIGVSSEWLDKYGKALDQADYLQQQFTNGVIAVGDAFRAQVASRDVEIGREAALNGAWDQGKTALERLNVIYDARKQKAEDAAKGYLPAELAALNRRTDEMKRERLRAIDLGVALVALTADRNVTQPLVQEIAHVGMAADQWVRYQAALKGADAAGQDAVSTLASTLALTVLIVPALKSAADALRAFLTTGPAGATPETPEQRRYRLMVEAGIEPYSPEDGIVKAAKSPVTLTAVTNLFEEAFGNAFGRALAGPLRSMLPTKLGGTGASLGSAAESAGINLGVDVLAAALDATFNGARRAAEALQTFNTSLESFRATVSGDQLGQQIASVHAQVEQLTQQGLQALDLALKNQNWQNARDAINSLQQLNGLEAQRIAQLQQEAAATSAAKKNAIQDTRDSYQLRVLQATGQDDAAFALQQQIEWNQAVHQGADNATLAALKEAQLAEARKRSTDALTSTITGLTSTIATLQGFQSALKLDTSRTTLNPMQQYAEAQRQYQSVLAAAQGGDQAAAGNLPAAAQAFLDASRAVNASGVAYAQDFQAVQQAVDAVTAMFSGQRSNLQQQLDALNGIADQVVEFNRRLAQLTEVTQYVGRQTLDVLTQMRAESRDSANRIALKLEAALLN